jgi:hypothetical protein
MNTVDPAKDPLGALNWICVYARVLLAGAQSSMKQWDIAYIDARNDRVAWFEGELCKAFESIYFNRTFHNIYATSCRTDYNEWLGRPTS